MGLHSKQPVLEASFAVLSSGKNGPAEGLFGWSSLVATRCSPCWDNSQGVPSLSYPGPRVRIARYWHPPPLNHLILQSPACHPPPQGSASSTLTLFTSLSDYLRTVCPLDNKDVIEKVSVPSHVILGATGDCRGRGRPSTPCCVSADMEMWCV